MPFLIVSVNMFMPVRLVLLRLGGVTLALAPVPCVIHVAASTLYGVNLTRHQRQQNPPHPKWGEPGAVKARSQLECLLVFGHLGAMSIVVCEIF